MQRAAFELTPLKAGGVLQCYKGVIVTSSVPG